MEVQLARITAELRPLQLEIVRQSGDVDSFLEEYEGVMSVLSECTTSWSANPKTQ